jgi:hypothetical protein
MGEDIPRLVVVFLLTGLASQILPFTLDQNFGLKAHPSTSRWMLSFQFRAWMTVEGCN